MLPRSAGTTAPPQPTHGGTAWANESSHFSHCAGTCHRVDRCRIAVPRPINECSPAFVGLTIQEVLDTIAAPGFDPQAFEDEDRNGDDRLCIKIIPNEGGPPQFDPAFVFVDNHI
jgi:hypothetical protein